MKFISNPVFFIKLAFAAFLFLLAVLSSIAIGVVISTSVSAAESSEPEIYALDTAPAIEAQNIEAEKIEIPASAGLVDLLRSTLLMVNAGNQTGDYSLLYANLTPPVQRNVDVDRLAQALAGFREEKVDMSAVSVVHPQFVKPPAIDANGVLNLTGYFPTEPRMVRFNLGYRKLNGNWRLEVIDLDAPGNPKAAASPAPAAKQDALAEKPSLDIYIEPPTTTRW